MHSQSHAQYQQLVPDCSLCVESFWSSLLPHGCLQSPSDREGQRLMPERTTAVGRGTGYDILWLEKKEAEPLPWSPSSYDPRL